MPSPALSEEQRNQLLLEHLPQVHHVARRIHLRLPPQVPLEDLIHAGILGLMDAVHKYDPRKNVQLKHYAEFRIRGAILDSLRLVDWSPRALRRKARRLEQTISQMRGRSGRDPSEEEIASALEMSVECLQDLRARLRSLEVGSLQSEGDDCRGGQENGICESKEEDPYHQALRSEMAEILERAMNELPAREREVLALHHFREMTMKEVGRRLSIGESRVSQLHSAALLRLRTRLPRLLAKAPQASACAGRTASLASRRTALSA